MTKMKQKENQEEKVEKGECLKKDIMVKIHILAYDLSKIKLEKNLGIRKLLVNVKSTISVAL